MASNKTSLIRSRDVKVIAEMMVHSWAAKSTAAQGGSQMMIPQAGFSWSEPNQWNDEVPVWSGGEVEKVVVSRSDLYRGVMTKASAVEIVNEAASLMTANAEKIKPTRKLRIPKRRAFAKKILKTIAAKERLIALAAINARLLKKNRRVGRQKISTTAGKGLRRQSSIPESGRFLFGGRTALRMPVGRPALPREVWLARYLARKSRRQRKNATEIKRNRGEVQIPETKFERPRAIQLLGP